MEHDISISIKGARKCGDGAQLEEEKPEVTDRSSHKRS